MKVAISSLFVISQIGPDPHQDLLAHRFPVGKLNIAQRLGGAGRRRVAVYLSRTLQDPHPRDGRTHINPYRDSPVTAHHDASSVAKTPRQRLAGVAFANETGVAVYRDLPPQECC